MRIPLTLFFSLFLLGSCDSQQGKQSDSHHYDTLHLLQPKLSAHDLATSEDFVHCIDLRDSIYRVCIMERGYRLTSQSELMSFLRSNAASVRQKRLRLLFDSATSPAKIINTIDLLEQLGLRNYRLASVDGKFSVPPVISDNSLAALPQKTDLRDSTALVITILDHSYETSLQGKSVTHGNTRELGKFLKVHQAVIDPKKVIVTGGGRLPYQAIDSVVSLLKQHGYQQYQLIVKD